MVEALAFVSELSDTNHNKWTFRNMCSTWLGLPNEKFEVCVYDKHFYNCFYSQDVGETQQQRILLFELG